MVSKQTAQALNKETEVSCILHRATSINLACQNGCVSQSCSSTLLAAVSLQCQHTLHGTWWHGWESGWRWGESTYGKKTHLLKVQSHQRKFTCTSWQETGKQFVQGCKHLFELAGGLVDISIPHVGNDVSYQILYCLYSLSLPLYSLPDMQHSSDYAAHGYTNKRCISFLFVTLLSSSRWWGKKLVIILGGLGWQPLPLCLIFRKT